VSGHQATPFETYLGFADLFYFGWTDFRALGQAFELYQRAVPLADARWARLIAEGRLAFLRALKASEDGRYSRGPMFAENQAVLVTELAKLKAPAALEN
jgi:hypothetical protein